MDHAFVPKSPTTPMLPQEGNGEKVVIIAPTNGVGKILIREDTILTNLQGCAGCRAHFQCAKVSQCSTLCWGKYSEKKYYTLSGLLAAIFTLSLIGTLFFTFGNTVNDVVISNMVIRNNSLAYNIWKRPEVKPLMKVHLFNYTNWERVKSGLDEKLHVEDVGPFVYSQTVERVNVEFEDDKLSYQEKYTFEYLAEKTKWAHFDQIYVPNLPLLGVVSKAVNLNSFAQFSLNSILQQFADHPEAFIKLPVHRFLWGYEDSIISLAKPYLSLQGHLKFENFGLLATKNGTLAERMTINTGENDIDKMNMIEKLNGVDHLSYWGSPECNSLQSSDGSMFPPSKLDRKTTLQVFFPNICRRVPFVFEKDVQSADGIQLLRYRMPLDVFDDPSHNPENQCYCEMDSGTCPPRGIINVTACAMGAPALASFPHFYLADPKLRDDVIGLQPSPLEHDSFMDIHPTLGVTLNGKYRLQINIQVRKTSMFTALGFLKQNLILPVAWLDMGVEELPESLKYFIYHGTYSTAAVQLGLSVCCVTALIVSGLCLFVMFVRRKPKPCVTLKKIPVDMELKGH